MASNALRALVTDRAPRKPYAGREKIARIHKLSTALALPYLQLNRPGVVAWLVFDIDKPGAAMAWQDANLPPPTWVATNPENGHAHVGYALAGPVCTTSAARQKPIRYLAAIEDAYTSALGADRGFAGLLSKNPLHDGWKVWEPANCPAYELDVLAEYADLSKKSQKRRPADEVASLGRNCFLFDELGVWARRAIRGFWRPGGAEVWQEAVRSQAESLNMFPVPLSVSEIKSIARSVARWTWRNTTPAGFRAWQSAQGVKSGASRRRKREPKQTEAIRLRAAGKLNAEIALVFHVTERTIQRWLNCFAEGG
jgi:hypothetical protein